MSQNTSYGSYGTRLFIVNPAYQCVGGPYTWGSKDSETYKFCSNMQNNHEIQCNQPGFRGKPYHFRYSTESDSNWKNTRCCYSKK